MNTIFETLVELTSLVLFGGMVVTWALILC